MEPIPGAMYNQAVRIRKTAWYDSRQGMLICHQPLFTYASV